MLTCSYNYCVCAVVNICELDPEVGHCEAEVLHYFYNVATKNVKSSIMEDVEEIVIGFKPWISAKQHVVSNKTPTSYITFLSVNLFTAEIDVCTLQPETGNCRGSFVRYFYNQTTERCELFAYGGCGGNGNRFKDLQNCEKTCSSGNDVV